MTMQSNIKCGHWDGVNVCGEDSEVAIILGDTPVAVGLCRKHNMLDWNKINIESVKLVE